MSVSGDSVHPYTRTVRDGGYMKTITEPGLTKRELFAAMAMQGLLARHGSDDYMPDVIARYATDYADALLAELAKDGEP